MSTVVVLTPVIIANWPVITAAVAAAVGSMGFAVARDAASSLAEVGAANGWPIPAPHQVLRQPG